MVNTAQGYRLSTSLSDLQSSHSYLNTGDLFWGLCLFILIVCFSWAFFWHQETPFSTGLRQKPFNPQYQQGQCCSPSVNEGPLSLDLLLSSTDPSAWSWVKSSSDCMLCTLPPLQQGTQQSSACVPWYKPRWPTHSNPRHHLF